jgi:hypothetical protein
MNDFQLNSSMPYGYFPKLYEGYFDEKGRKNDLG